MPGDTYPAYLALAQRGELGRRAVQAVKVLDCRSCCPRKCAVNRHQEQEGACRIGRLSLVYNTSGYDSLETLRWLDGPVDIYMPDFKFWEPALAERFTSARDYPAGVERSSNRSYRAGCARRIRGRQYLA
jgi:uncharacterized Fe-S radical SAM superfamily protein PflX